MQSIPEIGWHATATPLLLVRIPGMGFGTMTLEKYREAGRFRCCVTVLAVTTPEHEKELLELLPQERDHTTQAIGRRS